MRVAHVMAGAVHGGAERFFERLVQAQSRAGDVVLPVIRHDPARSARLGAAGLAPLALRFGGPLDLATRPRLRTALRAFAPDVVVSWMSRATDHMPRGDWVHVGRLGGFYRLSHYRRCDHLVGNTDTLVAWMRGRGWPAARSHMLPNFSEDFALASPATDLPPARPLLLALGRLHTDKGFDVLLRALAALPDATLAIGGTGPEAGALETQAKRLGVASRTHFLGWRDDPGALLRAADVFVCASRVEPLGNMVLEAWSAGTPVVAADASGPAELLAAGAEGLLVPRENPTALATAIRRVLEEPGLAARLRHAGRQRFEAEFSENVVLARWRECLASLTSPLRRGSNPRA